MQQINVEHMDHITILSIQIIETVRTFLSHIWFKIPIGFILTGFAFLFGVSNGSFLTALAVLVAFDFVMGVSAAYKVGEPIQSRRALKTATKLFVYTILASASFLVESIIPGATLLDNAMISFLAVTEFISIMENAGKMGFNVPQKILDRMKDWQKQK